MSAFIKNYFTHKMKRVTSCFFYFEKKFSGLKHSQ